MDSFLLKRHFWKLGKVTLKCGISVLYSKPYTVLIPGLWKRAELLYFVEENEDKNFKEIGTQMILLFERTVILCIRRQIPSSWK